MDLKIRYPQITDLEAMRSYINTLSAERTFIGFQGEVVSSEEEEKYLNSQLERIKDKKTVQLLVFADNKLIGISGVDMKDRSEKHVGVFGITIAKDFRGQGIGKKLMERVLEEAKNLKDLEIIVLSVYAENDLAKEMYKKFGFVEFGKLPKGFIRDVGYSDHTFMFKTVK